VSSAQYGAAKFAASPIVDCVSQAYNVSKTQSQRVCSQRMSRNGGVPATKLARHNATGDRRKAGTRASPHIISPDPFCSVKLGVVTDLWFFKALPVLRTSSDLAASVWRPYLEAVYGPLHPESFPIDLRCFTHWWHRLLPHTERALFQAHYRPGGLAAGVRGALVDYSGVSAINGAAAWQLYLLDDADVTSTLKNASRHDRSRWSGELAAVPFRTNVVETEPIALNPHSALASLWQTDDRVAIRGPVPSHTWIEVYHEFNDCAAAGGRAQQNEVGWWAHHAPGSGVWANVGRTMITGARGYRVACTATAQLTNRSSAACDRCCRPAHELLFAAATELKYYSMQSCCGQRGGTGRSTQFEIVFFTRTCDEWRRNNRSTACPEELNLRSGRARALLGSKAAPSGEAANAALRLTRPALDDAAGSMCSKMGTWRR